MDINFYHLLHIIGIATLFIGLGGMLAAENSGKRRIFAIWQGVGLVVILVSGFGQLAKLNLHFPLLAGIKIVLWAALAVLPVLARRRVLPTGVAVLLAVILAGVLAWIGLNFLALLPRVHA